ncbi:MAG: hypothetical protein ABW128_15585 [Rhizorhabdus sp.]
MTERKCGNCEFWHHHERQRDGASVDKGDCRYDPPKRFNNPEGEDWTLFPTPIETKWCGKFKRRQT